MRQVVDGYLTASHTSTTQVAADAKRNTLDKEPAQCLFVVNTASS